MRVFHYSRARFHVSLNNFFLSFFFFRFRILVFFSLIIILALCTFSRLYLSSCFFPVFTLSGEETHSRFFFSPFSFASFRAIHTLSLSSLHSNSILSRSLTHSNAHAHLFSVSLWIFPFSFFFLSVFRVPYTLSI